ncbi:MAG: single-stranded-DNA-specific exonuclease RecJ [Rhodospirillaceae bacterium]|jgi:single-stranded-DNA-specific exonuclease|nr:single-stranded-DNA-specific exonuclease RecJ [Rhodospirillaceae bacterium]
MSSPANNLTDVDNAQSSAVAEANAYLGISRSLGGRFWTLREADERTVLGLAQQTELPEIVARVLAARGVSMETAAAFLNPTLRELLPDPSTFKDMDKAAARIVGAFEAGETIAIFGDYDVDGATSSALLARFFETIGGKVRVYIPDRIKEGYGPNEAALRLLAEEGAGLAITVDCGITSFEPLAAAATFGLDMIIVDHHKAEAKLPEAVAVVNPNRLDEAGGFGHLAAVGVTYLLVIAVNRALRKAGWYGDAHPEPDLLQWLDLVALGTVCDMVPLSGLNRAFVAQGLKVMARRGNPGLVALSDVAGINEAPGVYHAGYILGPRVNAGGRVGHSAHGSRLLATNDVEEAAAIAERLEFFNDERRQIEADVLVDALEMLEAGGGAHKALVMVAGEGWHPGVVGIVASRLKEKTNRPACVFAIEDGIAKGSARSVTGVDLGAAVIAARQNGLLMSGGGHAMAAGLSVEVEKLNALEAFLNDHISVQMAAADLSLQTRFDGALDPRGATPELMAALEQAGPFGMANSEPRFVVPHAQIVQAAVVGKDHVRCFLTSQGRGGGRLKAIAFRCLETPLGKALLNTRGLPLHVAGRLRADNWQGREGVQFMIDDAAVPQI